jgi:hypothetical protein
MTTNKGQANGLQAVAGMSGRTDFPATNKAAVARKAIHCIKSDSYADHISVW